MSNSKPTVDAEIDEIGAIAGPDMSRLNEATDLESKIFILGVGAQRAGTSWLYTYLSSHPCVLMSVGAGFFR